MKAIIKTSYLTHKRAHTGYHFYRLIATHPAGKADIVTGQIEAPPDMLFVEGRPEDTVCVTVQLLIQG